MLTVCSVLLVLAAAVPGGDQYEQGHVAEAAARYADAANAYAAAAETAGPLSPYARVRAAVCRAVAGDLAGGAAALDEIIAADGADSWIPYAAHERALLHIRQNERAEAAALFSRAHAAPADLWWMEDVRWEAAENALAFPGHEAEAVAFFRQTAQASLWGKKRLEAARILAKAPAPADRLAAAIYLINSGASNEVAPLLETIPPFTGDDAALQRLRDRAQGRLDIAQGRNGQGLERLWALGTDPAADDVGRDALLDIVNHHVRMKQYGEAERAMLRLVALEPGSSQTISGYKSLAGAYAREAQPEQAEAHYAAVVAHTDDPREAQAALLSAANAYRTQGRAREAVERFNNLVEKYPKSEPGVEAAYWSGALLYEAGADRELVMARFKSAADNGVSNYYGHRAAELLAQLGDKDAKKEKPLPITPNESILRPIKLDPDKPEPALERFKDDERFVRLAYFSARGYPEAEWEALAIGEALKTDPSPDAMYLAMGEAGATAYSAMQFASTSGFGESADGSVSLTRLRIRYPRAYWEQVAPLAHEVGVDPYLMLSIARQESTYRPGLTSIAGAKGVMQLMPDTAKWLVKTDERVPASDATKLGDPRSSLRLGAHYLKLMLDRYNGNMVYALAAYNGGPGNCDKWQKQFKGATFSEFIEFIPFVETRNYVKRVLANYVTYHSIYPDA